MELNLIVLLSFATVALAAERSPAAQGRQVVLTQLILPNGQFQGPAPAKVIEAASAALPARQVTYNFPQLKQNYIDGFQYLPVFPGQAPVPYGASPFVYYPAGAPPYPPTFGKDDNNQNGGWGSSIQNWGSWLQNLNNQWQQGSQGENEEENEEEGGQGGQNGQGGQGSQGGQQGGGQQEEEDKKPEKLQQQLQQQQQQQFQQQQIQQHQEQMQHQERFHLAAQQIRPQQARPSQVFYNQQVAPESIGNRDGVPTALHNPGAQFEQPQPQFPFGAQPQFFGPYPSFNRVSPDPAKLTAASHGAVSNYLFLKNQPQIPQYHPYQQPQQFQRFDGNAPAAGVEITPFAAGGRGRPVAPAKQEKYTSVDAKNQRSPLYAQHVSALQVSTDPATIQGHLIAQSSPEALAAAGMGGMANAGPTGQAIVGNKGLALSAPKSTAIAGHPDIDVAINIDRKQSNTKPKKPVAKYSKNKGYHVDYSS